METRSYRAYKALQKAGRILRQNTSEEADVNVIAYSAFCGYPLDRIAVTWSLEVQLILMIIAILLSPSVDFPKGRTEFCHRVRRPSSQMSDLEDWQWQSTRRRMLPSDCRIGIVVHPVGASCDKSKYFGNVALSNGVTW